MEAIEQDVGEVAIPVPPGYRAYLAPRHLLCDLRLLSVHFFGLAFVFVAWQWGRQNASANEQLIASITTFAAYALTTIVIWRQEAARPWQYVLSERRFRVIEWQHRGRLWQWNDLVWDKEVISAVEEGEWRGLPMLVVKTTAKETKDRRVYVMVYAHEDREQVVGQVLPLIRQYRQRFRHEFWCEQWEA